MPLVVGNATSLFSSMIYSPLLTVIFGPQSFRWEKFNEGIKAVDDSDVTGMTETQLAQQEHIEDADMEMSTKMKRASVVASISSIVSTRSFFNSVCLQDGGRWSRLHSSSFCPCPCTGRATYSAGRSSVSGSFGHSPGRGPRVLLSRYYLFGKDGEHCDWLFPTCSPETLEARALQEAHRAAKKGAKEAARKKTRKRRLETRTRWLACR